jgi:hypothetical protein
MHLQVPHPTPLVLLLLLPMVTPVIQQHTETTCRRDRNNLVTWAIDLDLAPDRAIVQILLLLPVDITLHIVIIMAAARTVL